MLVWPVELDRFSQTGAGLSGTVKTVVVQSLGKPYGSV
jgi:hypothetical protein